MELVFFVVFLGIPNRVMFQQETHDIQEEESFCIWPLMSLCKGHGHIKWIVIISMDKLYPAAQPLNML